MRVLFNIHMHIWKPLFTGPSRFSFGTTAFSNTNSEVGAGHIPTFFVIGMRSMPGVLL
jgi:hypothetical protein